LSNTDALAALGSRGTRILRLAMWERDAAPSAIVPIVRASSPLGAAIVHVVRDSVRPNRGAVEDSKPMRPLAGIDCAKTRAVSSSDAGGGTRIACALFEDVRTLSVVQLGQPDRGRFRVHVRKNRSEYTGALSSTDDRAEADPARRTHHQRGDLFSVSVDARRLKCASIVRGQFAVVPLQMLRAASRLIRLTSCCARDREFAGSCRSVQGEISPRARRPVPWTCGHGRV